MEQVSRYLGYAETIEVAKVAVVRDNGDVLVLWRNKDDPYHPGRPDFPGGQIRAGESRADAVVREALEEAGLALAAEALRHVCDVTTYEERWWGLIRLARSYFVARVADPKIFLGDEHYDFGWLPVDHAEEVLDDSPAKQLCLSGVRKIVAGGRLPSIG